VIKINASKATLAYVDFDGVTALPALSTMTEVVYTRYVTLVKVSMTHGAMKILVVFIVGYEIKVEYSFPKLDYLS
jgi:hypothetical protein